MIVYDISCHQQTCCRYEYQRLSSESALSFCSLLCFKNKQTFNTSLSLMANLGRLPWVIKTQQPQEQRYPFPSVCVVFSCFQTTLWMPTLEILNMSTDVDICLMDTIRESVLKVDSGRKSLAALGTWTRVSIVPGFSVRCSANWAIPTPLACEKNTVATVHVFSLGVSYVTF